MAATKRALVAENIGPKHAMLCYDVGCNGNGADKMLGYRFHGLHGRVIPFACGATIVNQELTVIASAGDGATFSEGINHLVHGIRNNYNITFLLHNNANYGLTKGQASATTRQDVPMNASPDGVSADTINPMQFVLGLNPSFAARGFSGNIRQLTELIRAGINHRGFSFIEILQACPSFNRVTSHEWYQQRVFDTFNISDYDSSNLAWAREISQDMENNIATGIIYQQSTKPTFLDRQANRANFETQLVDEVRAFNITGLVNNFR